MEKRICVGKLVVATAAAWAVSASCYILFSPIKGQGVAFHRTFGEPGSAGEIFTTEQSWYEAQGPWGIFVLVVFAGLYLLGVRLAWRSGYVALAILSVAAIILSIITGFSVGRLYLPGAVALFIGAMILLSSRLTVWRL